MELKKLKYKIRKVLSNVGLTEAIIISKPALERLEKTYATKAGESGARGLDSTAMYLYGKADVITELLKLFEE